MKKTAKSLRLIKTEKFTKLKIVFLLTFGFMFAEVIAGYLTGSLALIADAGHMLTDAGGLALSILAFKFSQKPATPHRTYGFYRTEILASLANSVILLLTSAYILFEAYNRIVNPVGIHSFSMIIVAVAGLIVNLIGIKLLGKHSKENLNFEGAYLEVLRDTLGSIGVIAAGLIIYFTKMTIIDPIVSIGLAIFIIPRTWSLMKKSIRILMEEVPLNISYNEVKEAILKIKGVYGVCDLHLWSITSGMDAISAHVVVERASQSHNVMKEIDKVLKEKFSINHSTIQIEMDKKYCDMCV